MSIIRLTLYLHKYFEFKDCNEYTREADFVTAPVASQIAQLCIRRLRKAGAKSRTLSKKDNNIGQLMALVLGSWTEGKQLFLCKGWENNLDYTVNYLCIFE